MIKLYVIQVNVTKINVMKMSLIMMINWILIYLKIKINQLSYLDHSTFFARTISLQLRSLEYICNKKQGQIKVIKINTIKNVIKNYYLMSEMKVIKILCQSLCDSDQSEQNKCDHDDESDIHLNISKKSNSVILP